MTNHLSLELIAMLKLKFIKMKNGIIKQIIHLEAIGKARVISKNLKKCPAYGHMQLHHRQMRFTSLEEQLHPKIGHLGSSNFSMIGWGSK